MCKYCEIEDALIPPKILIEKISIFCNNMEKRDARQPHPCNNET